MCGALSDDLRRRILEAYEHKEGSQSKMARRFGCRLRHLALDQYKYEDKLEIYGSGVLRTNVIDLSTISTLPAIFVSPTKAEIYATSAESGYQVLSYNASGLQSLAGNTGTSNFSAVYGTAVQVDNGIAYLDSGLALNAETGTEPGTFYSSGTTVATGPMVSDSNLGKLFILENASSSRTSARCLLETHDGLKHRLAHFVSIVAMPRFIQSPDRLLCGPPDSHMNAAGVL